MNLWDLAIVHPDRYQTLFSSAIDPDPEDFRGRAFRGVILKVRFGFLGKFLFRRSIGNVFSFISGAASVQELTFRKRFYERDNEQGESGINYWPVKDRESMPVKISLSPCLEDSAARSLKIDYDLPANLPFVQRSLVDEVRRVGDDQLYIGRMSFRLFGCPIFFLWFALERM